MLDICRAMLELDCSIAVIGQLDETAGDVSAAGEVVLREQPFLVAAADDLRAADIVWCCGAPATARVVSSLRHLRERPMLVFDSVDLSHVRYAREARVTGSRRVRLQAGLARRLERLEASFADCVVAVTDEERDVVLDEVRGARVVVMPTYQELPREPTPGPEDRAGILFFGSFLHSPNVDAVEHLIHDIAPMIWSRLPEATITIAGSGPLPDGAPHEERVRMLGWVEDLDALMDASRVLLAPLRFGAGMKGKIARSLARGLPVATTPVGAEGLHLVPTHSAFVSDRDAELAHGCVELLVDDERWRRMSEEGQRVAASQLARSGAAAPLVEILESARLGR